MNMKTIKTRIISATLVGAVMIGGFGYTKFSSAGDTTISYAEITSPSSFGVFQYDVDPSDGDGIDSARGDIQLSGNDISSLITNQKAIQAKTNDLTGQVNDILDINKHLTADRSNTTVCSPVSIKVGAGADETDKLVTSLQRGSDDNSDYYSKYISAMVVNNQLRIAGHEDNGLYQQGYEAGYKDGYDQKQKDIKTTVDWSRMQLGAWNEWSDWIKTGYRDSYKSCICS